MSNTQVKQIKISEILKQTDHLISEEGDTVYVQDYNGNPILFESDLGDLLFEKDKDTLYDVTSDGKAILIDGEKYTPAITLELIIGNNNQVSTKAYGLLFDDSRILTVYPNGMPSNDQILQDLKAYWCCVIDEESLGSLKLMVDDDEITDYQDLNGLLNKFRELGEFCCLKFEDSTDVCFVSLDLKIPETK